MRCDAPKRVELYVLCEDWRAAGRECKERGDKKGLEYVFCFPCPFYGESFLMYLIRALKKQCPNTLIARELDILSASMK